MRPIGLKNQSGVGLISIIIMLLFLGLIGAGMVSIINTETFSAMGQDTGQKGFGLAEAGIEFILANRVFPNYSLAGVNIPLGAGSFTVDSPALTAVVVPGGANVNITVDSTDWFQNFPAVGLGTVGIIINGEEIECTSITPPTQLTTCNSFSGGAVTGGQAVNTEVYPVTKLNGGAISSIATTITVNSTRGFLTQGTIVIDSEAIYYTGTTAIAFTGCIRGYKGFPASGHAPLSSVTQYVITSTSTVPTAVFGNAQRSIRITIN